jgi:Family of unknown function (DUF6283)
MERWKLKRTRQCEKCPWRTATNPHDIPDGYTVERHRDLKQTIAEDPMTSLTAYLRGDALRIMACHEAHETHCIGWLVHQIGPGNNLGLRISMAFCDNAKAIRLRGPQHETFEATLPPDAPDS